MDITSAQYVAKEGENVCIKFTSNGIVSFAPLDPENTDYTAIQKWVADGNTIAEAD